MDLLINIEECIFVEDLIDNGKALGTLYSISDPQ